MSLVEVKGLRVAFGGAEVVRGVTFSIDPGECVALVGESGSGKSVTARALLGLAGRGAAVRAERLAIEERDLRTAGEREWRRVRGARVGLVLQDALVSLDPLRPIGREIGDAFRLHTPLSAVERLGRAVDVLHRVGMPDAWERVHALPGALSGGLRQRALIASAIALDPPLVIADEPTTALDMSVQRRVLEELGRLKRAGTGILLISHDLGVVAGLADRVLVLRGGAVVEEGPTQSVLRRPSAPYTRELVRAVPAGVPRGTPLLGGAGTGSVSAEAPAPADAASAAEPVEVPEREPVLRVHAVSKSFPGRVAPRIAVDDASLELRAGETLGIVGESGSGKTTLARMVLGLETPDSGSVELFGAPWSRVAERARRERRRRIGMVSQDTASSFDPRWSVARTVEDALPAGGARAERRARVRELLDEVGLDAGLAARRPDTLSGGQRQRLAIARTLAGAPEVLVLDEPVSALDVTVQARILDLLDRLQRRHGLAVLFISHDLDVIAHMSDRIVVMHEGRIVETGPTGRVLASPAAAYTAQLVADAPRALAAARE